MRGYDKWGAYLPVYRRVMNNIKPGSAYLEIGVQNMGWPAKLDPEGCFTRCVGCDINPAVLDHQDGTRFTDIVVGDATAKETFESVCNLALKFDLIVDDASHTQHDIIATFMRYWPLLRDGGYFMIEDTHTDFSLAFSNDNYFNVSIYEFFASLAALSTLSCYEDIQRKKNLAYRIIRRFYPKVYCDDIAESVKALSFANSCILIEKGDPGLGERILEGDEWPIASPADNRAFTMEVLNSTSDHSQPELAVVYLNRAKTDAERAARQRFIEAYQRFHPTTPHVLYVINKGFSPQALRSQYMLFKDISPRFIDIDDSGLDLEAYRQAAVLIDEPTVFFMNTHSEPVHPDWLDKVFESFNSSSQIGLAGCTGNIETLHPYFPGFPHSPRYHIRSNGFMISRDDYLEVTRGRNLSEKVEAYQLEAGLHSMTWMIESNGREAVVIGKRGAVKKEILWRANIFRSGNQGNLLLADNQTRIYQRASILAKLKLWLTTYTPLSYLQPQRASWHLRNRPLHRLSHLFGDWLYNTHKTVEHIPVEPAPTDATADPEPTSLRLAVLVPTHLEQLDENLSTTLLHNAKQVKGYKLEIILPESCSADWYLDFFRENSIKGSVRLVSNDYFGSPAAVNKMGTDAAFYMMYEDYDYILICHLDAWIFSNQLNYWMNKGYDFIGAPLFLPEDPNTHFLSRMAPFGSNGGLSLRRVFSCIQVLQTFKPRRSYPRILQATLFLAKNRQWQMINILFRLLKELSRDWRATCEKYNIYEDVFFTVIAPLCGNSFSVPSGRVAMRFACEVNYPGIQKNILRLAPPLGIHGYDKYTDKDYLNFSREFFERKHALYDKESLTFAPSVSVLMIVKNLIDHGRMASFDQAINSVLEQSYPRLEVVLLDGDSTDGTYEALQKLYSHHEKVVFHCKADNSVWEGMETAVDLATGNLIAVMNSDDYYCDTRALEVMIDRLIKTDADMVYGHTTLLTDSGPTPFPTHLPSVLNCFGVVHQAALIKKSVISTIKPFSAGHITAENYLFVATMMAGFKVVSVPVIVAHYRVGGLSSDLYGGKNYDKTVTDYVRYMRKLTTIGYYLTDKEIEHLYGFKGIREIGPVPYFRMILKIKDQRLRLLLLSGMWNQFRNLGMRRIIKSALFRMKISLKTVVGTRRFGT